MENSCYEKGLGVVFGGKKCTHRGQGDGLMLCNIWVRTLVVVELINLFD